jgi:hypothetical protein
MKSIINSLKTIHYSCRPDIAFISYCGYQCLLQVCCLVARYMQAPSRCIQYLQRYVASGLPDISLHTMLFVVRGHDVKIAK